MKATSNSKRLLLPSEWREEDGGTRGQRALNRVLLRHGEEICARIFSYLFLTPRRDWIGSRLPSLFLARRGGAASSCSS